MSKVPMYHITLRGLTRQGIFCFPRKVSIFAHAAAHVCTAIYRGISAKRNQNLRNHTGFCPPVFLI